MYLFIQLTSATWKFCTTGTVVLHWPDNITGCPGTIVGRIVQASVEWSTLVNSLTVAPIALSALLTAVKVVAVSSEFAALPNIHMLTGIRYNDVLITWRNRRRVLTYCDHNPAVKCSQPYGHSFDACIQLSYCCYK